ncbi:MAG: GWxTD domain-containing protein [Bacteroidetes bacterium]|nr:MAG: GWxTD domain-containing protein [Bacteroidota bacterium]
MTMRCRCVVPGLLLGLLLGLAGRPAPAQSPPRLQVDVDQATFALDEARTEVALYLAIEARSLEYRADSVQYRAPVVLEAALLAADGRPAWQDTSEVAFLSPDTSALQKGQYFVHALQAVAPPGPHTLVLTARNGRRTAQVRRDLTVPAYPASTARLSDVILATSLRAGTDEAQDALIRHGLFMRPNPRHLFGAGLTQLYYYAEAYHLERLGTPAYTVRAMVTPAGRTQPVAGLLRRTEHEARPADRIVGAFDLSAVPNGSYELRLEVLAGDSVSAVRTRKFFVYNPTVERVEPTVTSLSYENSEYALMSDAEVDAAIEHLRVLAGPREWRRARSIEDPEEKRRFLMEFWRQRDPNPKTLVNEFKEEFYRRLQYATERFGDGLMEGWKTERGRVFLKYGEPSSVQTNLYEPNQYPHEIWTYDYVQGEGQSIFVFLDRDGFGSFRLIHSNVAGEPKSGNWQMELIR